MTNNTIIITGANGSLAVPTIKRLLATTDSTLLLAVRNVSGSDNNTEVLRQTIAEFPKERTSLRQLDLSDLTAVHNFADAVVADISAGTLPPLAGVVCNAYYWNLKGPVELTKDGFEKTFQINHVSHAALVLRLLGSFGPAGGHIVLFSSDAHWPGKNSLQKYPPGIPENLELLAKPAADEPEDDFGHGFKRYADSKLAIVAWMYALNRYLEKDIKLSTIKAVAINPGNLTDSRALRKNTPQMLVYMSKFIIGPLRPLLRLTDPTLRTVSDAAADVADLTIGEAYANERGYFTLLKKDDSSPESKDEAKQQALWSETMEWAEVSQSNTALTSAFP